MTSSPYEHAPPEALRLHANVGLATKGHGDGTNATLPASTRTDGAASSSNNHDGEALKTVQMDNEPMVLAAELARAGREPDVEGPYLCGWVLRARCVATAPSAAS